MRARLTSFSPLLGLTSAVLAGVVGFIVPLFGELAPASAGNDFINHVALVAAAREALWTTGAIPISSDAIHPGVEYPYFLFGNAAFWIVSALVSLLLQAPAYVGMGGVLGLAFAGGAFGMYAVARRAGLPPYLAVAVGCLYAAGPYMSINLFLRAAYPEYVAWQALPALLLIVGHGLRREAGPLSILGSAAALASIFYVHKLVAPHAALTLVALALNAAPLRVGTVRRMLLIGGLAVLLTVPSWLPWMRAFDPDIRSAFNPRETPKVFNPSFLNHFWPYAQNSLPDDPAFEFYQQRFALQVGLIPTVGFLTGVWLLITQARRAFRRGIPLLLLLFVIYTLLILDTLNVWSIVPSVLHHIQFSYRLLGIAHFVGFLLLLQSLGRWFGTDVRGAPRRLARPVAIGFVVLATASAMTYWHRPTLIAQASAAIGPDDLRDYSQFIQRSVRSNFWTGLALPSDGWLAMPGTPAFLTDRDATSLVLSGTAPESLFEEAAEPLRVRVYGFAKATPGANAGQLARAFNQWRRSGATLGPAGAVLPEAGRGPAGSLGAGPTIRLPNTDWLVTELAQAAIAGPGPFDVRVPLSHAIGAVAFECSRVIGRPPASRCINVELLATPNEGDTFVAPIPVPIERRTRSTYGRLAIDARDLPPGHYQLPTFDYNFVRVQRGDGSPIPSYQYEGRTAIRHDGLTDSYAVGYDLVPELLAPAAALVVLAVYPAARRLRVRVPAPSPARWRARRGESRGTA